MLRFILLLITSSLLLSCVNDTGTEIGENFPTIIDFTVPEELLTNTAYTFKINVSDDNQIALVEIIDVFNSDTSSSSQRVNELIFETEFNRQFTETGTYLLKVKVIDLYPNGGIAIDSILIDVKPKP